MTEGACAQLSRKTPPMPDSVVPDDRAKLPARIDAQTLLIEVLFAHLLAGMRSVEDRRGLIADIDKMVQSMLDGLKAHAGHAASEQGKQMQADVEHIISRSIARLPPEYMKG
ncbi:MAG: hypothetical protein MI923_27270 [Phycisphaerales bacterium]|nr:hypothetical protein [Phycisphaerales bacterium]